MKQHYVFITYGSKRIKGVQTKAINIIAHLPADEVIILNHGDASWLKTVKVKTIATDFNLFENPAHIPLIDKTLKTAKAVIFCDFPTNMLLSSLVFWHVYRSTSTPICICDNIYSQQQFQQKVYSIFYELGDQLLLTGLALFKPYVARFPKALLIPPYFSAPTQPATAYRNRLIQLLGESEENQQVILHIAYNTKVCNIAKKIIEELNDSNVRHVVITTKENDEQLSLSVNRKIAVITGKLDQEEIKDFILGSDVVICKFGYQQLIEALSLGKPTLTVGDSGLKMSWLDKNLSSAFSFFPTYDQNLLRYLRKVVKSRAYRQQLIKRIQRLHDGQFDGGKLSAQKIKDLAREKRAPRQRLQKGILLAFNTKDNLAVIKRVMSQEKYLLPIIVTNRFAERSFGYDKDMKPLRSRLTDFNLGQKQDFLDPSLTFHVVFSDVAYHGLSSVFPFFDTLLSSVERILQESDKICIVGQEAKVFFTPIIHRLKMADKVTYYKTS